MSKKIIGSLAGCYSPFGKTIILQDADGNDLSAAVITKQEQVFDANTNDVREGKTFATNEGVKIGEKNIPAYRTEKGYYMISNGDTFSLTDMENYNMYDYTELQCIIAPFNSSVKTSVFADKVALFDNVYSLTSEGLLSTVSKNSKNKSIDLNIVNDSGIDYIIHYFTYREEV